MKNRMTQSPTSGPLARKVEDGVQLSEAEEWQRAQAWSTWEALRDGTVATVSQTEVMSAFGKPGS